MITPIPGWGIADFPSANHRPKLADPFYFPRTKRTIQRPYRRKTGNLDKTKIIKKSPIYLIIGHNPDQRASRVDGGWLLRGVKFVSIFNSVQLGKTIRRDKRQVLAVCSVDYQRAFTADGLRRVKPWDSWPWHLGSLITKSGANIKLIRVIRTFSLIINGAKYCNGVKWALWLLTSRPRSCNWSDGYMMSTPVSN